MRHPRLFPVALCVAIGVCALATLSAHAAPSALPPAPFCNPEDADRWTPDCKPVRKPSTPAKPAPVTLSKSVLPFTYAYVMTGPVALYTNPADMDQGIAPLRALDVGYIWVRLAGQTVYNGRTWYLTDGGGYLPASSVAIARPSGFQGIGIGNQPGVPFAWVLTPVKTLAKPGEKPDANSVSFKRYNLVNIYEQREAGGKMWYRVGDNQWLIQTAVAKVERTSPPPGVGPGEKWIDVRLFEQTVAAYEGDRMVYATLVSSGLRRWPTVKGLFRIYSKVRSGPMSGQEGKPDYYSLEDVPWAMYFHEGYSLHGTYWHDGFGYQHSHGCVNLSALDAQWFYNWTTPVAPPNGSGKRATQDDPGTWVWVHD